MSYLSMSEHRIWGRYMTADKVRQYRRILETTPDLKKFLIHGGGTYDSTSATDDEQVMELVTALCLHQGKGLQSTLEQFAIEFFTFSPMGWNALSHVLVDFGNLKRLFLRQVYVKNDDGETMPSLLIKDLLYMCPSLEQLHIIDCHLNALEAQELARQLSSTSHSTKLKVLSLEGNSIGNAGVKCIAKTLNMEKSSLISLDLDRVGCSTDAWIELAECLKHNTTLRTLACSGNGGVEPIDKRPNSSKSKECDSVTSNNVAKNEHPFEGLLRVNTTLEIIHPTRLTPQIDLFLRLNRAGRKLIEKSVTTKLLPLVLYRVHNDWDVIFYFLKAQSGTMLQTNLQ